MLSGLKFIIHTKPLAVENKGKNLTISANFQHQENVFLDCCWVKHSKDTKHYMGGDPMNMSLKKCQFDTEYIYTQTHKRCDVRIVLSEPYFSLMVSD